MDSIPQENYVIDDYDEENVDIDDLIQNVKLNIEKKQLKNVDVNSSIRRIKKNKKICLNMIVKNESKVIERCLTSCLPLIDYWVISDTGSTDGTQIIIKNFFKKHGIPGKLFEDEWINFGKNRSIALQHLRDVSTNYGGEFDIDYIVIIDADEVFKYDDDLTEFPDLVADKYHIITRFGVEYYRVQMVANRFDWKYVGILHEYIHAESAKTLELLKGIYDHPSPDGARSSDPKKYQRDAALLELALYDEPDNARYYFYLAQSYRDHHNFDKAIEKYGQRAEMGGFPEEVFYSLYQVALCKMRRGDDFLSFFGDFIKAYEFMPSRIEPLFYILIHCNKLKMYRTAYNLCLPIWKNISAKEAIMKNKLFLEMKIYKQDFFVEFYNTCFMMKDYKTCFELCNRLLNGYSGDSASVGGDSGNNDEISDEIRDSTIKRKKLLSSKVSKLIKIGCFNDVYSNLTESSIKDIKLDTEFFCSGGLVDEKTYMNNIIQKSIDTLKVENSNGDKNGFYNRFSFTPKFIQNYGYYRNGFYLHITPENVNKAIDNFNFFKITKFSDTDLVVLLVDNELTDQKKAFFMSYKPTDVSLVCLILNNRIMNNELFEIDWGNNELYEKRLKQIIFNFMTDIGCYYVSNYNFDMIYNPDWANILINTVEKNMNNDLFIMTTLKSSSIVLENMNNEDINIKNIPNIDVNINQYDKVSYDLDRDHVLRRQLLIRADKNIINLFFDKVNKDPNKNVEFVIGSFRKQLSYIIDYDEEKDGVYQNDRFTFEYNGFHFYPCVDSDGGDCMKSNIKDNVLATGNTNVFKLLIDKTNESNALAFNTNGFIKNRIKLFKDWSIYDYQFNNGIFVSNKVLMSVGVPY